MPEANDERLESLGPAERAIQTLTTLTDHMVHNRPGFVAPNPTSQVGVSWTPCVLKEEGGIRRIFTQHKVGKTTQLRPVGEVLNGSNAVTSGGQVKGEYRKPSDTNKLFPEVAAYIYQQIADIWSMDNAFAAHWASYAFNQESRDIKTVLAAFMLVQNRTGAGVIEDGELVFFDDDYRAVGEAMFLIKGQGYRQLEPKLIVRVGDLLNLPEIAEINRKLGFGQSARTAAKGRYNKAVTKWLAYREQNPQLLEGLLKSGQANIVRELVKRVRYKPMSENFFIALGWKQTRKPHRTIVVAEDAIKKSSLDGLSELEICEYVVKEKVDYKRLIGMLPQGQAVTRAIAAACLESGAMSEKDVVIMTPTLEALGLLTVEPYAAIWKAATENARDQRAANIARNVTSKEARDGLTVAVDAATTSALKEVTKDLRVYCMVDKSASMQTSLGAAKSYLERFLGGFPLDKLHVSVFSSMGTEVDIRSATSAGVQQAFRGHNAGGGTHHAQGLAAIAHHRPEPDEDVLFIFVGDQAGERGSSLAHDIQRSGLNPMAFGFLFVPGMQGNNTVEEAAKILDIPCFRINEAMFVDDDPYAVTRILRDLIASTPSGVPGVGAPRRKTLIQQILETDLLQVPEWA